MNTQYINIIPENLSFFDMEDEMLQENIMQSVAEVIKAQEKEDKKNAACS